MTDNLSPDNKPKLSDQAKPTDQPMGTPPSPEKKAILETPPQGTPIPQIATPPAAAIPPTTPVPDKKAIPETPPQGIPILQIPTPPAAETIPNKNSVDAITETPAPAPVTPPPVETPAFVIPETAAALPDIENPYILSGDVDRARLVAQTRLFKGYVEKNAKQFVGENVKSILDMGCGEGQLTQVLARLYPDAQIIGIDKDANAIEAARRAAKGLANVKFEVRDILQGLPSGPFDLVYASTVLIHLPSTPIVLKAIFDVLKPGGHLWTRDLHPDVDTAVDHPAYRRLTTWAGAAMAKIGASWKVGAELPSLLPAAGFTMLRVDKEAYTMGNETAEERIALSIDLGAFYNQELRPGKRVEYLKLDGSRKRDKLGVK